MRHTCGADATGIAFTLKNEAVKGDLSKRAGGAGTRGKGHGAKRSAPTEHSLKTVRAAPGVAWTRDDFSRPIRERAGARVGLHCSNPECQKLTSGPAADPARAINIGVAAHITAAAPGGPRYDPALSAEERSSIDNAIWLCAGCATMIDRDVRRFSVPVLRSWRQRAWDAAAKAMAAGTRYRSIASTEVRQELTVGQLVAVRALEDEFGCHVETEVHVPAKDGWLRADAAVVRGEELVVIDIRENHGNGVAYFQIEYAVELYQQLTFPRFQGCVAYFVVVSDASTESDEIVEGRLRELTAASRVETCIRMYRLNSLRAQYGL